MARRYRLLIDALNADRVEEIYDLLRIDFGDESVELDENGLIYCYVRTPDAARGESSSGVDAKFEGQGSLDVPAIDEEDARQLAAELEQLDCLRTTSIRRLGWFERWRRREQVFGNYSADSGVYYGV